METECAEAGEREFISSLGWEDRLIARTAGSPITSQHRDICRHARGQDALLDLRANVFGETHNNHSSGRARVDALEHSERNL
jgi:hypothetical protein